MTYDQWKARNPADDELGPEPEEDREPSWADYSRGWEDALNAAQAILHYAMFLHWQADDDPPRSDEEIVEWCRRDACKAIASLSKTAPPKPAITIAEDPDEEPF